MSAAAETCWRMACAMYAADPQSNLSPIDRETLVTWLQGGQLMQEAAQEYLRPQLLAWADARNPKLGATLRRVLGIDQTPTPAGQSALAVLAQYPGSAAREQAAALAGQDDVTTTTQGD